jgi:hypothetical protein
MLLRLLSILGLFLFWMIPVQNATALCASVLRDGDFEGQRSNFVSSPWIPEGRTGIDIRRGLSFHGFNNAWARNNTGWNAIRQPVRLFAGQRYTLRAFIRSSGNVRDGYFGFRDSSQRPVSEIRFGPLSTYQELRVLYKPRVTGLYNIFSGFWAPNQDSWIQVDNVRIDFPCDDVDLNPVDE